MRDDDKVCGEDVFPLAGRRDRQAGSQPRLTLPIQLSVGDFSERFGYCETMHDPCGVMSSLCLDDSLRIAPARK